MHFGPAHIVWEDENFETHHIQRCLDNFDRYSEDLTEKQREVVRWSLEEMLKIPEHIRNPEPDDYDNEHPELYPPAEGVEMVR
jgi:hypothetical protein